jgi:peroxiredoxin
MVASAESASPSAAVDAAVQGGSATPRRGRQALIGLTIALAIVAVAWFAGGRAGWDQIGQGGGFQSVLPKVGEPAPDFHTEDVLGRPVRLSDFSGRPVWLMFWGSWCPPCRAEFPDIVAAYDQAKPRGLAMLGVSIGEPPLTAAAYAAQNEAKFLVLSDMNGQDTGAAFPIFNYPTHIFIDANGTIQSIVLEDMDTEQALGEIAKIMPDAAR